MNKAYVILEKGFEYDDSIYEETEGGNPNLILFSIEDAKLKVEELNIKEFKNNSLQNYTYSINEILNVSIEKYNAFCESLNEKYGKPVSKNRFESIDYKLHPDANEEESKEYLKMVNFSFYTISETDIDTKSFRDKKINDILN